MPKVHTKTYCGDINFLNLQIIENIGESLNGDKFSCTDVLLALQEI